MALFAVRIGVSRPRRAVACGEEGSVETSRRMGEIFSASDKNGKKRVIYERPVCAPPAGGRICGRAGTERKICDHTDERRLSAQRVCRFFRSAAGAVRRREPFAHAHAEVLRGGFAHYPALGGEERQRNRLGAFGTVYDRHGACGGRRLRRDRGRASERETRLRSAHGT